MTDVATPPSDSRQPEYGTEPRARCGFLGRWLKGRTGWVVLAVAAIILSSSIGVAAWARGKGYKTAVLRWAFPNDPRYMGKPCIVMASPGDRASGVMPDVHIRAEFTKPNGKGVDPATLTDSVRLLKGNAREVVPARVNTDAVGSVIVLRPLEPLELNALYTFEVLPALKDTGGAPFERFTTSFSTAAGTVYSEYPAAGVKIEQPTTFGNWYTGVAFGPDGRLYASTLAGQIHRFEVALDGSLSKPQVITTLNARERGPRLLTGVTIDPTSTPDNVAVYVAHGVFHFEPPPSKEPGKSRAAGTPHDVTTKVIPDWSGKLTRLSGANLEKGEDLIIGLPRARQDHTTGQITFGPDGAMYFAQASNTAMGSPDREWGYRPERLLTANVMRLDLNALKKHPLPLDVKTEEGGTYDPYAPDAPLTIFATGVRNAYDLLWHSNGRFYATLNGSAVGGITPATPAPGTGPRRFEANQKYAGPAAPSVNPGTQNDYLLRLTAGGYYGHPNPTRAEYVLNGGNPTGGKDPFEVPEYPVGVRPDPRWQRPAFDFNKNLSPCGLTEYTANAFPALRGKILAVRFSGGKDLIVLSPDESTGDIGEFITGLEGFTNFHDPLDVCVSPKTGYIYVAEHTGKKITLIRPAQTQVSQRAIRGGTGAPATTPSIVQTERE